jgi:hypothetical protein
MTDKELLELAAKAAGYPIHSDVWACGAGGGTPSLYMGNHGPKWSPLTDDGDALRLMVALSLDIEFDGPSCFRVNYVDAYGRLCTVEQLVHDDPAADVRRAICRAAAEIGQPS